MQKPMLRVCYALLPLVLAAVYLFGWRSLAVIAVVFIFGCIAEGWFTLKGGKPITSAVFVTCLIYSLSLPPTVPFWMAAIGIVAGVVLGKMAFGGFGRNVFNPAMVGRCFIYITFPLDMTNAWRPPFQDWPAGLTHWTNTLDAVTRATPLFELRQGGEFALSNLFLGNVLGSMGETSAWLILLGGAFIVYKKAAPWRLAASCLLGGVMVSGFFHLTGFSNVPDPVTTLLAGSFLFGSFFVVTEPVTGPNSKPAQWIYGFFIGGLTVILRGFSNFAEGIMFSVLIMNAFVPILDDLVRRIQRAKRAGQ